MWQSREHARRAGASSRPSKGVVVHAGIATRDAGTRRGASERALPAKDGRT